MKDMLVNKLRECKDSELLYFLIANSRSVAHRRGHGGTTYGTVFEAFALRRLASGGKFRIKRLLDTNAAGVVTEASRTLEEGRGTGDTPSGLLDGYFELPQSHPQYHATFDAIIEAVRRELDVTASTPVAVAAAAAGHGGESPGPSRPGGRGGRGSGTTAQPAAVLLVPDTKSFTLVDVFMPAPPPAFHPYKVLFANVTTSTRYSGTIKMMTGRTQHCTTAEYVGGLDTIMSTLQLQDVTDACLLWLMPPSTFADAHQAMPLTTTADWQPAASCDRRVAQYAVCVDFSSKD
jgi:hypothetical protein